uniref:MARVEL domain-containing protein n=1 Tax=Plectus sambesii TaxID=2011161 RepID=A0A914V193_9BILA
MSSHTTTSQGQVDSVRINVEFLSTYQGVIKLIELFFAAFANLFHNWCVFCYTWYYGSLWFLNFATPFYILSFWINVFLFVLHLFNLNNVLKSVNWRLVETIFCTACAVFSFIFMIFGFWSAWIGYFRFHLFFSGIIVIVLCASFAAEAFLLYTGRTQGVIVWNRNIARTTTTSPA